MSVIDLVVIDITLGSPNIERHGAYTCHVATGGLEHIQFD